MALIKCPECGKEISNAAFSCPNCGYIIPRERRGEYNKYVALFLCIFFGWCGAHRFYEGNPPMGFLYCFTFGILGIGWIFDIVRIASKPGAYYDA